MLLRAGAEVDAGAGSELGPPLLLACFLKPRKVKAETTRIGVPRAAAASAGVPATVAAAASSPGHSASGAGGGRRPDNQASTVAPWPLRRDVLQRPRWVGPGCRGADESCSLEAPCGASKLGAAQYSRDNDDARDAYGG
jgi:hypothetical protein